MIESDILLGSLTQAGGSAPCNSNLGQSGVVNCGILDSIYDVKRAEKVAIILHTCRTTSDGLVGGEGERAGWKALEN